MRLRYLGGAIAPNNQPLSNANTATGVAAQYQGSFSRQDVGQAETRGLWTADPYPSDQATVMNVNADNAANGKVNNTFIDTAQNLPVTRTGTAITQGSFTPFSVNTVSWSNAFDGTGDYLDVTPGADLALGTGSWTIEFFVYFATLGTITWLYDPRPITFNGLYPSIYKAADNTIRYFFSSADQIVGPVVEANKWYHVAVACDAGINTQLFVDGVNNSGILGTSAINFLNGANRPRIGASGSDSSGLLTGYISNVRVLKGIAQYTSNFVPPTTGLGTVSSFTQLITCQSNRFVDTSGRGQAITPSGNPTVSTLSPFYTPYSYTNNTFGGSLSFSGSSQYLDLTGSSNLAFGAGDWTIDLFYYTTTVAGDRIIYDSRPAGTQGAYPTIYQSGTSLFFLANSSNLITASAALAVNTWYYIAVSKVSGQTRMYINAAQVGTTYTDSITYLNGASRPRIGDGGVTAGSGVIGNISNLRVLKGTGLYSATTITPPTQPLQAITNTQLLTCQGAIVDTSANAFSITATGAVAASTLGPFSTFVNQTFRSLPAGSIFYDGTAANYLTLNGSSTLAFGSNNFGISMWVYINNFVAANQVLYDSRVATAGVAPALYIAQTTNVLSYFTNNAVRITGTTALRTGQWYYITLIRSAGNTTMTLNDVQEGATYVDANVYLNGASRPVIGAAGDTIGAGPLNGFIYGLAVRNGSAGVSGGITFPNFSPNTVANSVLSLLGTNAGMYDTVGFTDYQVLGNAQVTTNNIKYGSGAMFFDGTGDWLISTATTNNSNPLNGLLFQNDFTIEAWINVSSYTTIRSIVSKGTASTGWTVEISVAGKLSFAQTAVAAVSGNFTITPGVWTHIAVVRSGSAANNIKMYVNGILDYVSASAVTTNFNQTNLLYIGADRIGATPFVGYISDLRITRAARYLTEFVPPQATFPKH